MAKTLSAQKKCTANHPTDQIWVFLKDCKLEFIKYIMTLVIFWMLHFLPIYKFYLFHSQQTVQKICNIYFHLLNHKKDSSCFLTGKKLAFLFWVVGWLVGWLTRSYHVALAVLELMEFHLSLSSSTGLLLSFP